MDEITAVRTKEAGRDVRPLSFKKFSSLLCRSSPRRGEQVEVADLAVVAVEDAHHVGGLFEHLLGHRDRVGELLEVERGDALRRRERDDLVVDEAEEVLNRLK